MGLVRRSVSVSVVALTCVALAPVASADTRYAEPLGNGPEPCLQADPCDLQIATAGHVSADVDAGDEVIVLPGDYPIGSGSGSVNIFKAIDVHGAVGQPRPRILTGAGTGVILSVTGAKVSDLIVQHTGTGFGIDVNPGTVERLYVRSYGSSSNTACRVSAGTVRDSVCFNNRTMFGEALSGGVGSAVTRTVVLRNVTAISTASGGYGARYDANSGGTMSVDARNSIFAGGAGDLRADQTGATTTITAGHSNYDLTAGAGSVTPAGSGTNQILSPQFAGASGGDFHQVAASPTIDAGGVDPLLGSVDFDGDPRSIGSAPDIGADEFIPVIEPPIDTGDETAPETTITKSPKRKSAKRKARLAFSSNEPGSSFECTFDGGAFTPCASPLKRKVKRGKHRFEVRATDAAGNVDQTPGLAKWKVKRRRR